MILCLDIVLFNEERVPTQDATAIQNHLPDVREINICILQDEVP
jgi:hypothetical protein